MTNRKDDTPEPNEERAALAAADAAQQLRDEAEGRMLTEWRLENGVVLNIRPVPPHALRAAAMRIEEPKVPRVYVPSREREEENPNDPEYRRSIRQYAADVAQAGLVVGLMLGTTVQSVPEGMYRPEHDGWITELREAYRLAGVEVTIHETPEMARYLDWLQMYAIQTDIDLFTVTRLVTTSHYLLESEVQRAAASFRALVYGPSDLERTDSAEAVDGTGGAADDPGDGAGVRAAGDGEVVGADVAGVDGAPAE